MSETGSAVAVELSIERLGAQGDGIARAGGGDVFVPFALAGELVRAVVEGERGRLVEVMRAAPERVTPVCRHFTACGGCAVQHLALPAVAAWKRQTVVNALQSRGLDVEVGVPLSVGLGARRRVTLSARREGRGMVLGFFAAGTDELVGISECPVADGRIVAALPGLAELASMLPAGRDGLRLAVLAADSGLDVDVAGVAGKPDAVLGARLAGQAQRLGLARLSLDGDPLIQTAVPSVTMDGVAVAPPPGVFLQASAAAEDLMREAILAAVPKKAKRAADLYCGLGAFTFALARRLEVTAMDSDTRALEALEHAARRAPGRKAIATRRRDLMGEPLSRKELEGFDVVVFDPPRAGAREQAANLAKSAVPVVVAVSCNPATLARDLRLMVDGGYAVTSVRPIDQFVYSPHVEVVAVLERPGQRNTPIRRST
ncbi:MAG: methyltransferase [Hyphomicrobiaceae bacterium]|nr:methyltransferase [Hyphomicrobiaceae bacterium]